MYETSNADVGVEEERVHRYCTPQYRAPELCDVRCGERLDERVDLWALGVALYKMLFLADLFGTSGEEKLAVLNFDPDARLDDANLTRLAPTTTYFLDIHSRAAGRAAMAPAWWRRRPPGPGADAVADSVT